MPLLNDFRKCCWLLVLLALCPAVLAQTGEFLPEVDAYLKLRPDLRVWLQAKETYEAGAPVTAEFGPSLDFYLKSLPLLSAITTFDNDDSKSSLAIFTLGYRYLPYPSCRPPTVWSPSSPSTCPRLASRSSSPTATASISIGRTADSPGVTAIVCNCSAPGQSAPIICRPTSAPRPITRASTPNGPTPPSPPDAISPSASTSISTPTTNTRTRPAKAPTSSTTSSASCSISSTAVSKSRCPIRRGRKQRETLAHPYEHVLDYNDREATERTPMPHLYPSLEPPQLPRRQLTDKCIGRNGMALRNHPCRSAIFPREMHEHPD